MPNLTTPLMDWAIFFRGTHPMHTEDAGRYVIFPYVTIPNVTIPHVTIPHVIIPKNVLRVTAISRIEILIIYLHDILLIYQHCLGRGKRPSAPPQLSLGRGERPFSPPLALLGKPCPKVRLSQDRMPIEPFWRA